MNNLKNALYAGSFNPIHEGHISILKKLAKYLIPFMS
ncbi:adenylyltransferase/cytidyltransferase family protein [Mycoplasmopsis cynos]|nr:adenylyltransferase/cytidyltransferase family protein [Mycoplasmopsis cynos]